MAVQPGAEGDVQAHAFGQRRDLPEIAAHRVGADVAGVPGRQREVGLDLGGARIGAGLGALALVERREREAADGAAIGRDVGDRAVHAAPDAEVAAKDGGAGFDCCYCYCVAIMLAIYDVARWCRED